MLEEYLAPNVNSWEAEKNLPSTDLASFTLGTYFFKKMETRHMLLCNLTSPEYEQFYPKFKFYRKVNLKVEREKITRLVNSQLNLLKEDYTHINKCLFT